MCIRDRKLKDKENGGDENKSKAGAVDPEAAKQKNDPKLPQVEKRNDPLLKESHEPVASMTKSHLMSSGNNLNEDSQQNLMT